MGLHYQAATEGMAPVGTVARAVGQVLRIGTYHVIKELQNPQLQPLAVKMLQHCKHDPRVHKIFTSRPVDGLVASQARLAQPHGPGRERPSSG